MGRNVPALERKVTTWSGMCLLWRRMCLLWSGMWMLWSEMCLLWRGMCLLCCGMCVLWRGMCLLWNGMCLLWSRMCLLLETPIATRLLTTFLAPCGRELPKLSSQQPVRGTSSWVSYIPSATYSFKNTFNIIFPLHLRFLQLRAGNSLVPAGISANVIL